MVLILSTLSDHALYLYQVLGKISRSVSELLSGHKNAQRGIIP